tara:strand:- start:490 stop:1203 length:714 start_codon:yes stop_codon:yes gene_type:complete
MTTLTKFSFDTSFDSPAPSEESEMETSAPPPPVFSEADMARSRAEGVAEGRALGLTETTAALEAQQAAALEKLVCGFAEIAPAHGAALEESRREVLSIARAVIAKTVPEIARENAFALVETAIVSIMPKLMDEPRAVIRVGDNLMDALQGVIDEIKRKAGYSGDIILLSEAAFGPADCTVEWADGGAEYHQDDIWRDVNDAIDRYFAESTPPIVEDAPQQPENHTEQTPQLEETPHG